MPALSVRELNSNISKALARVEAGETLEISRNGRIIAELRPKRARRKDDPVWRAGFEALMEDIDTGVPFGRVFDYDERNS
jgi:antitoxin (DNA-binding transcriptional repressor) of toxin-antitoxin stability system